MVWGWGVASLPRRILTGSLGSRAWNFDTCTGSMTPPCPPSPCRGGEGGVTFPLSGQGRHTGTLMSELNGWPASPRTHLSSRSLWRRRMLHPERHRSQRRACGQSQWLVVLCKTLSFSFPSRFIPALSLTPIIEEPRFLRSLPR